MPGARFAGTAALLLLGCAQLLDIDDYENGPTVNASTGTASSSAAGTSAASSGAGGVSTSCPPASLGPALVPLEGICIDATEVTEGQYGTWLAQTPDPNNQAAVCVWNTAFLIDGTPPPPGSTLPMVNVDWCDALAFCTAAGKRLCGRIGGGSIAHVPRGPIIDPESEWYRACTAGDTTDYPYGDQYDAMRCNGLDRPDEEAYTVGALPECRSSIEPYAQIVDLSGNVYEWEDACSAAVGADDLCHRRGGSYLSPQSNMACNGNDDTNFTRATYGPTTGFRCCADPVPP